MPKLPGFKPSTYTVFLVYLGVLLSFFLYAGLTGTRMLGDDKEEYKAESGTRYQRVGSSRVYRSYHK